MHNTLWLGIFQTMLICSIFFFSIQNCLFLLFCRFFSLQIWPHRQKKMFLKCLSSFHCISSLLCPCPESTTLYNVKDAFQLIGVLTVIYVNTIIIIFRLYLHNLWYFIFLLQNELFLLSYFNHNYSLISSSDLPWQLKL